MTEKEFKANIAYLEEKGVAFNGPAWDAPFSAELENRTRAGGDMIINLEETNRESLKKWVSEFDINNEVVLWWPNGEKGRGVPFSNIKEHYEDLEEWLEKIDAIADGMPY